MIWEISTLIASIAFLILVAFLVPTILQLRRTAKTIEDVSGALDKNLPDILANLREISINLSAILAAGRHQAEALGEVVDQVTGAIDDVVGFRSRVKKQVESPLLKALSSVSGATRALHAFLSVFLSHKDRRKKNAS